MKIVLSSVNADLTNAWNNVADAFKDSTEAQVEVSHGDIFQNNVEAFVSPANSFGFMDGGIDMAYSKHFGWQVEERVQKKIKEEFDGELLVGQALIVRTGDDTSPFLIAAPTMRIPSVLAKNTVNPYLAARAVLLCAKKNGIKSFAMPGLGTGIGGVSATTCALQVAQAIREVLEEEWVFPITWADALDRHSYLHTGLRGNQKKVWYVVSIDKETGLVEDYENSTANGNSWHKSQDEATSYFTFEAANERLTQIMCSLGRDNYSIVCVVKTVGEI